MDQMNPLHFDLPKDLIAQAPAEPRDQARLLVYDRQSKTITDSVFAELPKFLPANTTLVLNNSKVEKCRLIFDNKEIFILQTANPTTVTALVRPGKAFRAGATVSVADGLTARVLKVLADGRRTIEFSQPIDASIFDRYRQTPFPPYIAPDERLSEEYQTVYAKPLGSKAAPTAGLHFTPELLQKIKQEHPVAEITLHVGLGTFAPLRAENMTLGKLHAEECQIDEATARVLNKARDITAVGTTTVRCLESARQHEPEFQANTMSTDIFIQPGYQFKAVNHMITNFHLPGTSLLLMVAAFIGSEAELLHAYQHAIDNRYRFYSFGDAMLIL